MSKLFEEAIADAKKLKEVAEENAKKAILESVTPQIKEFIESQLLEETSEGEMCEQCGKPMEEGDHNHDHDHDHDHGHGHDIDHDGADHHDDQINYYRESQD